MFRIYLSIICLGMLSACGLGTGVSRDNPTNVATMSAKEDIVVIRNTTIRIQYDIDVPKPVAIVDYAAPVNLISHLLFINRDVVPVVKKTTGCEVYEGEVSNYRVLSADGATTLRIYC